MPSNINTRNRSRSRSPDDELLGHLKILRRQEERYRNRLSEIQIETDDILEVMDVYRAREENPHYFNILNPIIVDHMRPMPFNLEDALRKIAENHRRKRLINIHLENNLQEQYRVVQMISNPRSFVANTAYIYSEDEDFPIDAAPFRLIAPPSDSENDEWD